MIIISFLLLPYMQIHKYFMKYFWLEKLFLISLELVINGKHCNNKILLTVAAKLCRSYKTCEKIKFKLWRLKIWWFLFFNILIFLYPHDLMICDFLFGNKFFESRYYFFKPFNLNSFPILYKGEILFQNYNLFTVCFLAAIKKVRLLDLHPLLLQKKYIINYYHCYIKSSWLQWRKWDCCVCIPCCIFQDWPMEFATYQSLRYKL